MRKLFISYYFQYPNSASGIQARRLINNLLNNGDDITVIADKIIPAERIKHSKLHIIEIKSIKNRWFIAFLKILLCDLAKLPDIEKITWNSRVLSCLNNKINIQSFDEIHTIGYPFSTHLLGLRLIRKVPIKWVSHFFDPWSDNSYRSYFFSIFKKIDSNIENKVAQNSDVIIHTNKYIAERWKEKYGIKIFNKIIVKPFLPDIKIVEKSILARRDPQKPIIFAHIGNLYGNRDISPLIKAFESLIKDHHESYLNFEIRIVGHIIKSQRKIIENSKISKKITLVGKVNYEKALNEMLSADVLVLLEENSSISYFFPSKLVDYLAVSKPIIAISPNQSVATDLLKAYGHYVFNFGQHNELSTSLFEIISLYTENNKFNFNSQAIRNFIYFK